MEEQFNSLVPQTGQDNNLPSYSVTGRVMLISAIEWNDVKCPSESLLVLFITVITSQLQLILSDAPVFLCYLLHALTPGK